MAWGETIGSISGWVGNVYEDYTSAEVAKANAASAKQSTLLEQAKGIATMENKEKMMLYGSLAAIGLAAVYMFSGKKR